MTRISFEWLKHANNVRKDRRRADKALRRSMIGSVAYGQEGEDLVLASIFFRLNGMKKKTRGFYVDVGAHHPYTYSNTAVFSSLGWTGINIEPSPDAIRLFAKYRPLDLNVQSGVGSQSGELDYFMFVEAALNTFDADVAAYHRNSGRKFLGVKRVTVKRLSEILESAVDVAQSIDLLNVDVEGFDLQVLQSNNWEKFQPRVVAIEQHALGLEDVLRSDVALYLRGFGYTAWAKTASTILYVSPADLRFLRP